LAKGNVSYKNGQNLEPIAQAITSMGQSANKKDKPDVLANKIKAISTDATGVESEMLAGKTFYAGGNKKTGSMANRGAWTGRIGVNGKVTIPEGYHNGQGYVDQSITVKGSITPAISVTGNNPMYVRIPQGAYFTNASSGYPETSITLAQLRGAGMALQSELTAMTTDRDNWKNVANSKLSCQVVSGQLNSALTHSLGKTPAYAFALIPNPGSSMGYSYMKNFFVSLGTKAEYYGGNTSYKVNAYITVTDNTVEVTATNLSGDTTVYLFG